MELRKISFSILNISVFILFISSMYPWFFWGYSSLFLTLICFIVFTYLFKFKRFLFLFSIKNGFAIILLASVCLWNGLHATLFGFIEFGFIFFILLLILNLRNDKKHALLLCVTKYFSIFIAVSLFFYMLWLLEIDMPHSIAYEGSEYECHNYYFFVVDYVYYLTPRFKSIFAEPGHLTMGIIPLVAVNRFNIHNRYVVVLIIAELFTLSLAGYCCLFVLAVLKLLTSKYKMLAIAFLSLIFVVVASFITVLKSQESFLYNSIFARIENYSSGDSSKMGDRFKDNTIDAYEKLMNSSGKYWGLGFSEKGVAAINGSSGYKVYILLYGVIGALLILLLYFQYLLMYRCYWVNVTFFIYLLLLIQNGYPLWYAMILTYILGLPFLKYNETKSSIFPSCQ